MAFIHREACWAHGESVLQDRNMAPCCVPFPQVTRIVTLSMEGKIVYLGTSQSGNRSQLFFRQVSQKASCQGSVNLRAGVLWWKVNVSAGPPTGRGRPLDCAGSLFGKPRVNSGQFLVASSYHTLIICGNPNKTKEKEAAGYVLNSYWIFHCEEVNSSLPD